MMLTPIPFLSTWFTASDLIRGCMADAGLRDRQTEIYMINE